MKFKHGSVASQQQNREAQNLRLTRTMLLASLLALLCWFPLIIVAGSKYLGTPMSIRYYLIARFLGSSNAIVNPVMHALRIPEFRPALVQYCVKKQLGMNVESIETERNQAAFSSIETQLRTLYTDSNSPHQNFDKKAMDTKM